MLWYPTGKEVEKQVEIKSQLIAFTGGGTAGHVFPGLAVAEELKDRGYVRQVWIGSMGGMEEKLVAPWGLEFVGLPAGKLRRYFSFRNFLDIFLIAAGFMGALWFFLRHRPGVLFSKGGFVSVPPVWAASLLGIPVISHESDLDPGLATKLNMGKSTHIFTAYPETAAHFPIKLRSRVSTAGNPVRKELLRGQGDRARSQWQVPQDHLLVLVLGGSQGARQVNEMVTAALPRFAGKVFWVHQTGPEARDIPPETADYHPRIFLKEELPDLMAGADVIVSRAGAGALWEAAALGKPLVLIPLGAGSRGDQVRNAALFSARGAALTWDHSTGQKGFEDLLEGLLTSPARRAEISRLIGGFGARGAASLLADRLEAVAKGTAGV